MDRRRAITRERRLRTGRSVGDKMMFPNLENFKFPAAPQGGKSKGAKGYSSDKLGLAICNDSTDVHTETNDNTPQLSTDSPEDDPVTEEVVLPARVYQYRAPPRFPRRAVEMASNNAFPALDMNSPNRSASNSPAPQVNGNGASYSNNYIPPLPVGHQQDLNFLYQQIQELSGLLQANRERVNDVTKSAEEVARRAALTNGHSDEDNTSDKARIQDLERELAKANKVINIYKHEQTENTKLIGMYEEAVWNMTTQIRTYCGANESRILAQKRRYNDLLQQEKDEHLQTRLDRDHWFCQTLKVCEMIRKAHRLRTDEWCDEYRVVVGLQSEVRCLRRCLGMEAEKPEEETGWPYLKDAPFDDQAR